MPSTYKRLIFMLLSMQLLHCDHFHTCSCPLYFCFIFLMFLVCCVTIVYSYPFTADKYDFNSSCLQMLASIVVHWQNAIVYNFLFPRVCVLYGCIRNSFLRKTIRDWFHKTDLNLLVVLTLAVSRRFFY